MELMGRIGNDRFTMESPMYLAGQLGEMSAGRYSAAVVYPFDPFTEIGPFLGVSSRLAMAGPWVVGAFLNRSGFDTRIVQQVWNPKFQPSRAEINGKPLDLLAVSSMIIHSARARDLIKDASLMGENRPFVVMGGPKVRYQPADAWRGSPETWPDVVVTGEVNVLLSLLKRLLLRKYGTETLAQAWGRLCQHGEFHDIPGLVFRSPGDKLELVTTGVPQMSKNLERPLAVEGLALYERPGRHEGLGETAMPLNELRRYVRFVALPGFTQGCTRTCGYCPLPGLVQYSYRWSPEEFISEDILRIHAETGVVQYFAGDDSQWNSKFCETLWNHMAKIRLKGRPLRGQIKIGTEAVLEDVEKRSDLLPVAAEGGLFDIYFGIETYDGDVDKGQTVGITAEVFAKMRSCGISPMAMTMLFPGQGWNGNKTHPFGVSETMRVLDRLGASYMQMTCLTPSPGSRYYEGHFLRREIFSRIGRYAVEDNCFDGNRVAADFSEAGKNPSESAWRQVLLLGAYWRFYNPGRFVRKLVSYCLDPTEVRMQDLRFCVFGLAQAAVSTIRCISWIWALWRGPWEKYSATPEFKVPMRSVQSEAVKLRVPKKEVVEV